MIDEARPAAGPADRAGEPSLANPRRWAIGAGIAMVVAILLVVVVNVLNRDDATESDEVVSSGATATAPIEQSPCFTGLDQSLGVYVDGILNGDSSGLQSVIFEYGTESDEYNLIVELGNEWIQVAYQDGAATATANARAKLLVWCEYRLVP